MRKLISLDTNILVRFIVQDDVQQYQKILDLFTELEVSNKKAFVPLLVVLEFI